MNHTHNVEFRLPYGNPTKVWNYIHHTEPHSLDGIPDIVWDSISCVELHIVCGSPFPESWDVSGVCLNFNGIFEIALELWTVH